MNLEIHKTLVASTGHLINASEIPESSLIFYDLEFGWLLFIGESGYPASYPNPEDLNPEAAKLVRIARENGCDWIRFDCDGPVVEGVGTFDW